MQYHIDGRFQVEIRRENESWAVVEAAPHARASLQDAVRAAGLKEDDMAAYLEALVEEMQSRH